MGLSGSKKKDDRQAVAAPPSVRRPSPVFLNASVLLSKYADVIRREGRLPDFFLVHETPSSEWVDEDGDEAHEFYSEGEGKLHKIITNLRPKGVEKYNIPRLHPDVPLVLFQLERNERGVV